MRKPDLQRIPTETRRYAEPDADDGEQESAQAGLEIQSETAQEQGEGIASAEPDDAADGEQAQIPAGSEAEAVAAPEQAERVASVGQAAISEPEPVQPSPAVAPVKLEPVKPEPVKNVAPEPLKAPFFTVHVGSYQKRASAQSEAARIKAKGLGAFIERADLGRKGVWYRVKVGRFKTRPEAEKLQKKIQKVLVADSMVVTQKKN